MHKTNTENFSNQINLGVDILSVLVIGGWDSKHSSFLVDDLILATNETRVSLDADNKGEQGRSHNGEAHNVEGILVGQLTETKSEADSTGVTTSTNDTGNRASAWGVDVRDNSIAGTFSGLDTQREEDHDNNGTSQFVGVSENYNQGPLEEQKEGLCPETSSHTPFCVALVTGESAQTTSEKVHPAKDGGNGSGRFSGLTELILEVKSSGVVHGKFNTEAAGVLDKQKPSVKVHGTTTERSSGRNLWACFHAS